MVKKKRAKDNNISYKKNTYNAYLVLNIRVL